MLKNKKPSIKKKSRPPRYRFATSGKYPLIPGFLLEDFFNQFTEDQQRLIFDMLSYLNRFYEMKHLVNRNFFIEHIGVLFYFTDNILRDLKDKYSLRINGFKALMSVYYMQTILNRGVKKKEIAPIFTYSNPRNRTCQPSLKWLQSIGLLDRRPNSHFFYVSNEGLNVIRYISTRVTVYKREFIKKQAELKWMIKHSKI